MGGRDLMADVATMTSREIAELTGKRHDQVLRTARDLVEQGVTQSVETLTRHEQNGVEYPIHVLNKRDSLVLVARLSPEFTGRVVDRWMELEAAAPVPVELSRLDLLELALTSERERIALAAQVAEQAPKVAFVDSYVTSSTGSKGFREVCKLLKANESEFREFLLDKKIMYRLSGAWTPHAAHLDAGRFEVKTGTSGDHAFTQAKFTAKGIDWVAGEWAKFQIAGRDAKPGQRPGPNRTENSANPLIINGLPLANSERAQ
jgi:phage antirepressor YoqD-like protein